MYIRTKENQAKHDNAVALWARELIKNGWQMVFSDLPGNQKPPQIGDHIPDIYGKNGYEEIVIEIETEDSKNSKHSLLQIQTFNFWKNQSQNRRFLMKIA